MNKPLRFLIALIGPAVLLLASLAPSPRPALAQGPTRTPGSAVALTRTPEPVRPAATAIAPPRATSPGYTLITSLSADPTTREYTASFTPDVRSIFAWAMIAADNGAQEKQFQVDVQFISPNGQQVASDWFEQDTGAVTTGPAATLISTAAAPTTGMARRQLDVSFTPNERLTGRWTVVFDVDGRTAAVESFVLANDEEVVTDDLLAAAQEDLEQQGYTYTIFDLLTAKDGSLIGRLKMPMVSSNPYSAETSKQVVDGFTAMRKGMPKAGCNIIMLEYDPRYEIWYTICRTDWDSYARTKNFALLAKTIFVDVYDRDASKLLSAGAKDFMNKNFGAGTMPLPLGAPGPKQASVGSIRVQVSPFSLPADGASVAQLSVTVFDKRNKPLSNAPLTFKLGGNGGGTVDAKAGRTDGTGQAVVGFKAGTKDGVTVLTVSSGTNSAAVALTLGKGSSDPAAGDVIAYLGAQGYAVPAIKYDEAKATVRAVLDPGTTFDVYQVPAAIIDGTAALRENYPDATTLEVAMPYRQSYQLIFPAGAAEVDQAIAGAKEAGGDAAKVRVALQAFLNPVFDKAWVADARTGQPVGMFKDVMSKAFGGG